MNRFLFQLASAVKRVGTRRPSPRGQRRAYLQIENLEERLALSASSVGLPGSGIAVTDQVCGYKHRPPCNGPRPRPYLGQVQAATRVNADLLAAADVLFGHAEGTPVSIYANHLVVTPPEGPLPT
jgi:hypothetical protein